MYLDTDHAGPKEIGLSPIDWEESESEYLKTELQAKREVFNLTAATRSKICFRRGEVK